MTLSVSPALVQVETALKVSPGSFAKNNYRSVFDVARMSRKQFIADNISWLGLRGGRAWDLAVGQAQHIRRLFRENQLTRQVRQGLPQTLSGQQVVNSTSPNNIQGLVQDGPTWRNQFAENWQAYCQSGAPEAVDSPVSYLTWLYKQALTYEQEISASSTADQVLTLTERRPDLATLTIDNDAINQQIPALQLVNEILEESIATVLPANQSVDETLAETRYPTLLPYHFPHDQVELALQNASVPLEEIISETATDWPWFLNDSWQGARSASSAELASRLAPEQQTLVTEADNSTGSDLTAFYKTNLGVETADYIPFADLDTFTHQLGLTVPQVEELVAGNAGGSSVVISSEVSSLSGNGLEVIGAEFASGRFGSSLSLYNRQDSYGRFLSDAGPAAAMKGDQSFSITMWVNVSTKPTDNQMPIICNCLMNSDVPGIRFCVNSGDFLLGITDATRAGVDNDKKNSDGATAEVSFNVWYLICLTWDSVNKSAGVYYQKLGSDTVSTITVDASSLTGDMITAKDFTWVLNDSGDASYYKSHPAPATLVNCKYDDIGIFSGVLSKDDFSMVFNAGSPLSDINSGLSIPYAYYYPIDESESSCQYGAAFINAGKAPAVKLAVPEPSELIFSNTTYVNGKFGQGIQTTGSSDSYFYFQPEGRIAQAMKGDKSFTLGFWFYRNTYTKNRIAIFSNAGDANNTSHSSGFYLCTHGNDSGMQEVLAYTIDDSNGKNTGNWWYKHLPIKSWYYVALSWDAGARQAYWYTIENGNSVSVPTVTLDAFSLGDITTADGFTWAFNTCGDLKRGMYAEDNISNFIYDDIVVFNRALTTEEINIIATSGKPVAETDLSGFSAACIWTSSLDHGVQNLSDARMDRINRMVRLQRWLG
ncbi:Tc toxin subunit A, partial [Pseudescherichia sp.]|uniref:Tc toxin subunit A n=1 Tax=Pseudescherichia sp. TaxID=2055881 RepID=UPI0028982BD8